MTGQTYFADDENARLIDAVEPGASIRSGAIAAHIGEALSLSTEGLEAYFFKGWRSELIDLLIVAAAVEFCDLRVRRPSLGWARRLDVRVAVYDVKRWSEPAVVSALTDAVGFLTGDVWSFEFVARTQTSPELRQSCFDIDREATAIMPYSDGLDSRAVAAIVGEKEGRALVRVRLGTGGVDRMGARRVAFATVPYEVSVDKRSESTARSRGFKFAVVTGIAAELANINRIVVTESGQGALGSVLAATGQAYPDYRVHPAFTMRVERLFAAYLNRNLQYEFPRLWHTKGETLAEASALSSDFRWADTRSCWQQSRQVGFNGRRRQCGICAACLLRRMSLYRARLDEASDTYVWESLSSSEFEQGAVAEFSHITDALREYAIAGTLHLDHLAAMYGSNLHARHVARVGREVATALRIERAEVDVQLRDLLRRHKDEWVSFLDSLGSSSFLHRYASVTA